jgi:hypothetical protein
MSMLCSQCGAAAERCEHCGAAVCARRFCAELHEAACAAVSRLPSAPPASSSVTYARTKPAAKKRERNPEVERAVAEQLMLTIGHHRQAGRAALIAGDLDTAFDELWAARQLEPDLDRLGADARAHLPSDWEIETDLTPLARALAAKQHPRAADAWRGLLEDRPARSIQAEAAEWLAHDAAQRGRRRAALRALHAASRSGKQHSAEAMHRLYREAGLDPTAMFKVYLTATHLDAGTARAMNLRDPLTDAMWADQDARWWLREPATAFSSGGLQQTDHQLEALGRARDLAATRRDHGWLALAEGDLAAEPIGVRDLGRTVRAGCTDPADEATFVRIRLCYEAAAADLPDVAWPWYRLAELLGWAGFGENAASHLAEAERRSLGPAERMSRPALRALVQAGLGQSAPTGPARMRPFPTELYGPPLAWRLRLR